MDDGWDVLMDGWKDGLVNGWVDGEKMDGMDWRMNG